MSTALVTGAAGFLGRSLCRALQARGVGVRALLRQGTDASALMSGTEVMRGDVTDPAALRSAVEGCDLVYHLAGVRRATSRDEFMQVNAGSTRLLLEASVAAGAGHRRFVLAGSLAAIGPSRDGKREDDPFAPAEWYGESKAEAERLTLSYGGRLPVAIGRPPRIMGPGDRENLFFFRIVKRGVVLRILGPQRPLSWIDVDDCAEGFALLGEHPAAMGHAFFLASNERTSVEDLQREVARALGITPRAVPVPPALLSGLAVAAELVTRATGHKLPLNRKLARQVLAPGWTCVPDKAERLLGFTARTSLRDSIARSARFYLDRGWL
ncbi:MAG TPA: NAD-dependent epimerase/dehydratase family protein [Anaeromyxobacteraceae bacterium]|nr:NAD-dependent epimerase/dehydratase family protein [Anaeromyxobacteraceae bacterium]